MAVTENDSSASSVKPGLRTVGPLRIDPYRREVHVAGRPVSLTRREYALLIALANDPTRCYTREQLYRAVWGCEGMRGRALDAQAARLRVKLNVNGYRFVHAEWGVGYRLMESQPLAQGGTVTRFLITETNEYLVEATDEAHAEAIYMEHGPDVREGPVRFLNCVERFVQEADHV